MKVIHDPRLTLRPVVPGDYPALVRLESDSATGPERIRPEASPTEVAQLLWNGVQAQATVRATATDELVGLVTCYDADLRNGHAWLAVRSTADQVGTGLAMLGLGHLVTDLFREWPLRTLYALTSDRALPRFASILGRTATVQGVLRGYRLDDGAPADRTILAVERDAWLGHHGARLLRRRTLPHVARIAR